MSCSAFRHFVAVAAYLENAVSHRYAYGNRSSFFTAKLEMCGNSSFRPAQKLIRGTFVYISFKAVSLKMSINS
jgi:hypothetical protein